MPLYPPPTPGNRPWWFKILAFEHTKDFFGVISALLLLASIGYGLCEINNSTFEVDKSSSQTTNTNNGSNTAGNTPQAQDVKSRKHLTRDGVCKVMILVLWIVAPPLWFWFEYVGLYRYEDVNNREKLEQFKYTQDLASKIWLGLITALTILYFGKDIRS